ncbi:hypothetical protein BDV27DRAFT_149132 [Aspergillus caelatus]|uniref:Fe2OG dioxygenase domain-containing protein n=1 Tax=Aspergillus caelatus TaxID=61420 RepID=A0A5N6ZSS9_9EURO|nr:uncharacterized protein BDV27DRAFT_149132 [Aspergillus caelatus]KAE8359959.1 hypothetical protein BDV27DRAFT_149132 [Aspergillus caelatus]
MPAVTTTETPLGPPSPSRPRAPIVEGPKLKKPTRPSQDLPLNLIDEARRTKRVPFNPKEHLAFEPPQHITMMRNIGLEGHGISPNAVSDPFPLFTKEAMMQMRAELFSEWSLENCRFGSDLTPQLIRGLTPDNAPFCFSLWWSPEVLKIVSDIAGIELVPCYDYEVANVNISINDQNVATVGSGDQAASVSWHYDSVPFVCVTMASDCTGMIGGETAIKLPDGGVRKVRGPSMGTAVIMQGRYLQHQALKAFGGRERIAMVTSFRPKNPLALDETTLNGLRAISNTSELYTQYTNYRMEIVEERFRMKIKEERDRIKGRRAFDLPEMRRWLEEQRDFIDYTLEQLIEV